MISRENKFFIGLIFLTVILCLNIKAEDFNDQEFPSIHYRQLQQFRDFDPGEHSTVIHPRRTRYLTHTVYGWYPYWMGNSYLNLDWDLISHISFFCLEATSSGAISNDHGWPENWTGLIGTAQAAGVNVTITCTLFNSSAINVLIGNATYRDNLINNLVQACLDGGVKGVNIDFEGSSLNASNLVVFMQELRIAFDAAIPDAHISMATPAVDWSGCFDYDQLAAICNNLIPMCYDYHWKSGNPGPVSPLSSGTMWSEWCVEWTVNDYIYYGTPRNKLAIGVPYYGYDWPTVEDPPIYPPPATLNTGPYGEDTATARFYNFIRDDHGGYTKYWDTHSQTPWYYYYIASTPRQVWYDDHVSLGLKYDLVLDENLDGIGIWALGYDEGYTELWDEIDTHFGSSITPTPSPTAPPTPYTLIIDNSDPECTTSGGYWIVGEFGITYGPDKLYSQSGMGSGWATYSANLPAGNYDVTAWVNDAAYTEQANYSIQHSGGTTNITQSQEYPGGSWCISLGNYYFNGLSSVSVSDDSNHGIVIADAIRWIRSDVTTPTPTPTPSQPLPSSTPVGLVLSLLIVGTMIAVFSQGNGKTI